MGFLFDIKGQLNTMRLADSKALWPLFEAVVNSIQSIEDSPNRDSGKIVIHAYRNSFTFTQTAIGQNEALERFESFSITDNGLGLNGANYTSFNTAYSTLKVKKGCKGIGRFLWLKAFDSVLLLFTGIQVEPTPWFGERAAETARSLRFAASMPAVPSIPGDAGWAARCASAADTHPVPWRYL